QARDASVAPCSPRVRVLLRKQHRAGRDCCATRSPVHACDTRGIDRSSVVPRVAYATTLLVRNLHRTRPAPALPGASDLIDLHPTMTLLSLRGVAARTLLVSALAASSVVSLAASPGRVPAPDPLQGDGRVSAFYTWDRDIPARPGVLLRTEP
ncbi:hypothetical protein M3665_26285, partial [Bacillus licheniformis]|nr:hypothetical protein [Bacillus licheniformis]